MTKRETRRPGTRGSLTLALTWLAVFAPAAAAQFYPPIPGETVRLTVDARAVFSMGLPQVWEGVYLMIDDGNLIGRDAIRGGLRVPLRVVETLDVRREKEWPHALKRGAIGAAAFGGGMYLFLRVLCRGNCGGGLTSAWFPAVASGSGFGLLVAAQGPGEHWVRVEVPVPLGTR